MKYKLELESYEWGIYIYLIDSKGSHLCWIYDSESNQSRMPWCIGEDGFWFETKAVRTSSPWWDDYYKHREVYVTEAKKLLIKHML